MRVRSARRSSNRSFIWLASRDIRRRKTPKMAAQGAECKQRGTSRLARAGVRFRTAERLPSRSRHHRYYSRARETDNGQRRGWCPAAGNHDYGAVGFRDFEFAFPTPGMLKLFMNLIRWGGINGLEELLR